MVPSHQRCPAYAWPWDKEEKAVEQEVNSGWRRERFDTSQSGRVASAEGFELCIATFSRVPRR